MDTKEHFPEQTPPKQENPANEKQIIPTEAWKNFQEKTYSLVRKNTENTISGILIILGILVSLLSWDLGSFSRLIGGALIGCAIGNHYGIQIREAIRNLYVLYKRSCLFDRFFGICITIAAISLAYFVLLGGLVGLGVRSLFFKTTETKK